MVLPTEIRKKKLKEVSKSNGSEGRQKLFYRGENKNFNVYRIDLDYLIYNRHNGRIEAEMQTWEQENSASIEGYDEELHERIKEYLWNSSTARNKITQRDLVQKGQQRPGIVSLDGVIIDGNRRAMLLQRLQDSGKGKQYFDAIILPDAYADNQKEIVRLETQYQLAEDAKVEYGPLQKYLHARRLHEDFNINEDEIDDLMGEPKGTAKKLLGIMQLMDDYLEHIGCQRLYLMLKDEEGMFVDLFADLKRINSGNAKIPWAFDQQLDPLNLKLIQFDYIRYGKFADAKKVYREISHQVNQKNFFANKDIWREFSGAHEQEINSINVEAESLESFINENSGVYTTKHDAARARDEKWREKVDSSMKRIFNQASYKLELNNEELKPSEYLKRALDVLKKIDIESDALLSSEENKSLASEIGNIVWQMKKRFDRSPQNSLGG